MQVAEAEYEVWTTSQGQQQIICLIGDIWKQAARPGYVALRVAYDKILRPIRLCGATSRWPSVVPPWRRRGGPPQEQMARSTSWGQHHNNTPPADLWRRASSRGHSGGGDDATVLADYANKKWTKKWM